MEASCHSCPSASTTGAMKKGAEFMVEIWKLLKMVARSQCGTFLLRGHLVCFLSWCQRPPESSQLLAGQYCPLSVIYNSTDLHFSFHIDYTKNWFSQTLLRGRMGESGFSPVLITDNIVNLLSFCLTGKKTTHIFFSPSELTHILYISTSGFE